MEIKVEKHINRIGFWAIIRNDLFYLGIWENWASNFRFEFIDNEMAIEKFKANIDHGTFLFNSKEDALAFLEYLEPFIIMEELMG